MALKKYRSAQVIAYYLGQQVKYLLKLLVEPAKIYRYSTQEYRYQLGHRHLHQNQRQSQKYLSIY